VLKVKAVLDTRYYETGTMVTNSEYDTVQLHRHKVHPDWNYTILLVTIAPVSG
jgi:hypothetical protein